MLKQFFVLALCAVLGVSPAFAGSMTLLGAGKVGAAASGLMLDGITSGIKAAYSTRKLLTAYAGSALQVQKTNGAGATQDIGFSSGALDYAAITTFCSGTECRVIKWYDQSGGGFDLTSSSYTNSPLIFENGGSGLSKFINSTRPAPLIQSGTVALTNATLAQNPVNTLYMNAVTAMSVAGAIIGGTANNNLFWDNLNGSSNMRLLASQIAVLGTSTSGSTSTGSVIEVQYNASTGAGSFWVDGAAAGTFTNAHTFAGGGAFEVVNDISQGGSGNFGELVMYDLVGGIPSGSRTSIEANQKAYWGTP